MTSLFNPRLLSLAKEQLYKQAEHEKRAFTPTAAMMGGGGGGGDPAAAGGGDPAAAAAQAAPQGPPALTAADVQQIVQQQLSQQGGGAGGAAGGQKKKVDVNTEIYQIKKLLVMLIQYLDIPIPAHMLLGNPAEDPDAQNMAAASGGGQPDPSQQPGGLGMPGVGNNMTNLGDPSAMAPPGMSGMAGGASKQSAYAARLDECLEALGHLLAAKQAA